MDKAVKTAKSILKYVMENKQRQTAQEIFQNIETMGREIGTAEKMCFPVTNTFKRIISAIR